MSSDKSGKTHVSDKTGNVFNESKDYTGEGSTTSKATQTSNPATDENKPPKKKITIVVDEDDPCLKGVDDEKEEKLSSQFPGSDPRFQQQNQTLRCWVMYTDFYRCERILGAGSEACTWFQHVYKSICPNEWMYQWDRLREAGKFPWHKYKTQGKFPGSKYGD
ncbi:uncharacterized protein LOC143373445 [Andrena cerasifolii]|uniref:uncharacterized protein LOC143373445 n=1 Tax=Andrena cerasifolii TaxID=2819439 RepID=UPI004038319A